MDIHSQQVKSDIDFFQGCVYKLSGNIQSVSSLWKDSQYYDLASGVSGIAMQSRDVLVTGDKLCESIERFFNIADEHY